MEQVRFTKQLKWIASLRSSTPTGLISLYLPPGTSLPLTVSRFQGQYTSAANIKSPSTAAAVKKSLGSLISKLKELKVVPPNGLVVFIGNPDSSDDDKWLSIDLEPPRPIREKHYFCGNYFDTSLLEKSTIACEAYGFIVVDGSGYVLARVEGTEVKILAKKEVILPKKHKMGGQSSQRFQRIYLDKRHVYVKSAAEAATMAFMESSEKSRKPNVKGLVVAGICDSKDKLIESSELDPKLREIVLQTFDLSEIGTEGLAQAIRFAQDTCLKEAPLTREKTLLKEFFQRLVDSDKIVVGPTETIEALDSQVVETLFVSEEYPDLEALYSSQVPIVLVSKKTSEGLKFLQSLGGIGAFLKYQWTASE